MKGGRHLWKKGPSSLTHIRAETKLETKLIAKSADDSKAVLQPYFDGLTHTSGCPGHFHQTCSFSGITKVLFLCSHEAHSSIFINLAVSLTNSEVIGKMPFFWISKALHLIKAPWGFSQELGRPAQQGCCRMYQYKGSRNSGSRLCEVTWPA